MEAIKQSRIKRKGKELVLILPDSFTAEEVDVLIWPSNEGFENVNKDLSAELLKWPEMTDEELSVINEKRKHLDAYK
jgi:hypothetical protein